MTDRVQIIENGKYCLLKLNAFECFTEMKITDEELFLLAAEAAKISVRRIERKHYANNDILDVLRKAVKQTIASGMSNMEFTTLMEIMSRDIKIPVPDLEASRIYWDEETQSVKQEIISLTDIYDHQPNKSGVQDE